MVEYYGILYGHGPMRLVEIILRREDKEEL
jgi:hypothetical protein